MKKATPYISLIALTAAFVVLAQNGLAIDDYTVATATTSNETIPAGLSTYMGRDMYCNAREFIEGPWGTTIALLIALYGMFVFLLESPGRGVILVLTGTAFTFVPSIFENFVAGMSKLSHGETKNPGWIGLDAAACAGNTLDIEGSRPQKTRGVSGVELQRVLGACFGPLGWAEEIASTRPDVSVSATGCTNVGGG